MFAILADAPLIVFGINPLEELDLAEIQKVLLLSGVNVIPEEEAMQSLVPPIEQPVKPKLRRKACRKSTGRRPPRSYKSPIIDPVAAPSPPPATQPLMTQMALGLEDHVTRHEDDTGTLGTQNQPLGLDTSRRRDQAVSRTRKRRVVEFFSSTSPEPQSNVDRNQHHGSQSTRATGEGRLKTGKVSVGRDDVHSSPQRSPPLTGLVTQLPVSSMDGEEESPPSEPLLTTQQVIKPEDDMQVNSSPTEDDRQNVQDMAVGFNAVNPLHDAHPHIMQHPWELDEDEDGLDEADFILEPLLVRESL